MSEGYVEEFMSTRLAKDQSSIAKELHEETKEPEYKTEVGVKKSISTEVPSHSIESKKSTSPNAPPKI